VHVLLLLCNPFSLKQEITPMYETCFFFLFLFTLSFSLCFNHRSPARFLVQQTYESVFCVTERHWLAIAVDIDCSKLHSLSCYCRHLFQRRSATDYCLNW